MTLGEKIRNFRTSNKISQEELAERMNVSRQAITKWENDKGIPDIDNLIQLSQMMNTTLDELVLGKNCEQKINIEEQAAQQRKENKNGYLIGIIFFLAAMVIWIVLCIVNICNGNDIAAILNVLCVIILVFPIGMLGKKYLESKRQRK